MHRCSVCLIANIYATVCVCIKVRRRSVVISLTHNCISTIPLWLLSYAYACHSGWHALPRVHIVCHSRAFCNFPVVMLLLCNSQWFFVVLLFLYFLFPLRKLMALFAWSVSVVSGQFDSIPSTFILHNCHLQGPRFSLKLLLLRCQSDFSVQYLLSILLKCREG